MYSYEDRIRAVKLYIKLGKRLGATIRQLGYPTKNSLRSGPACLNSFTPRDKETAGGLKRCRVVHGGGRRLRRTGRRGGQLGAHQGISF